MAADSTNRSICTMIALFVWAYQAALSALICAILAWEIFGVDQVNAISWVSGNPTVQLLIFALVALTLVPAGLIGLGYAPQGVLAFATSQIATVLIGLALRGVLLTSLHGVAG